MSTEQSGESWSLEVVRGADAGRRYGLADGTITLGNGLDGVPGIDLSAHEANSPRRMAARQAQIRVANGSLSLRDLGSPGGTFVDRRRVPSGSDLPLKAGDVIQVGGVQLVVARGEATSPPRPTPPPAGFLFTLRGGSACRTWDDFLAISAQKWSDLRDELTSGRLSAFLTSIGRADLAPDARAPGSPDERLDAWIGRLPTTRPSKPELEVHPSTLAIRAQPGGGVVRKTVLVSNSGFRLLRATARVEPVGTTWVSIAPAFRGGEFLVVESAEVAIEATLPEAPRASTKAELIFESNGGTARVSILLEPITARTVEPGANPIPATRIPFALKGHIGLVPIRTRLVVWPLVAVGGRALIALSNGVLPAGGGSPSLLGPAVVFAAIGAAIGLRTGVRGEPADIPPAGATGGILGAMLAALVVALCRTVEAPLAVLAWSSPIIPCLTWGAIGAGLAAASILLIPPIPKSEVPS